MLKVLKEQIKKREIDPIELQTSDLVFKSGLGQRAVNESAELHRAADAASRSSRSYRTSDVCSEVVRAVQSHRRKPRASEGLWSDSGLLLLVLVCHC